MTLSRQTNLPPSTDPLLENTRVVERTTLDEETFRQMIAIERKRTERSSAPFLLMLLEADSDQSAKKHRATLDAATAALLASSRDTDLIGWYKDREILGAIFTGLVVNDKGSILDTFLNKINATLREELSPEQFNQLRITFHFFPDDWDHDKPGRQSNAALYPDLAHKDKGRRPVLITKRMIDIAGSTIALVACAPLFLIIALAVKLTSEGPVFFRQSRFGRYGKSFTFLKFRTMYVNNDATVHREYVTSFIANQAVGAPKEGSGSNIYKLTNDKRITRVGRFLRRTSLDELPQFINVLVGDMSLVGPRPPVPYEIRCLSNLAPPPPAGRQAGHHRSVAGAWPQQRTV